MEELSGRDRLEEIARMLGGDKISGKTRAHAREMLEQAQKAAGSGQQAARDRRSEIRSQRPEVKE